MPSDSDAPSELWLAPGFLVGVQVAGARVPGDEFSVLPKTLQAESFEMA